MKLQFLRYNKTYIFNANEFNYSSAPFPVYLVGTTGWGVAPSHQLVQRGPFQNGDTYVGYRLDPRIMQLPIVVHATSAEDMFSKRAYLSKVFRIADDDVQVRVSWTDDTGYYERSILGRVVGGLQFDTDARSYTIRTVVQIKANDPTWFTTFQTITPISAQLFGTPTSYPKVYPVTYGAVTIDKITTITYDGSADSYPIIQATGPLTNLTMVDTLGHQIVVSGTIPAGSTWTFDLSYGVYTVVDQNNVNKFGSLSVNSDLVNWRLYAESDAVEDGINTISVSASGTTSDSDVTLYYSARYIGV